MKSKNKSKGKEKDHQGGIINEIAAGYKLAPESAKGILPYASFEITNFRCFDSF